MTAVVLVFGPPDCGHTDLFRRLYPYSWIPWDSEEKGEIYYATYYSDTQTESTERVAIFNRFDYISVNRVKMLNKYIAMHDLELVVLLCECHGATIKYHGSSEEAFQALKPAMIYWHKQSTLALDCDDIFKNTRNEFIAELEAKRQVKALLYSTIHKTEEEEGDVDLFDPSSGRGAV